MDTKEMSSNLVRIAYELANQPRSACPPDEREVVDVEATCLETDEIAALEAFLSERIPVKRLLSDSKGPIIENNWWS